VSYLNEKEADAFFHEGDTGTYDGGPAISLAPVGMADLIEADKPPPPSAEQLARRERLKRLVTTVVSTLGVGSALVFALRVTRQDSDAASAAPLAAMEARNAPRPAAMAAEPAVVHAAVLEEAPAPVAMPSPTPAPEAASGGEAEAARLPAAPPQPAAQPAKAASVTPAPAHPMISNRPQTAERAPVRPERVSLGRASLVKTTASRGSAAGGHSPPTANFPD
jgi:translation initiation factor IF-2